MQLLQPAAAAAAAVGLMSCFVTRAEDRPQFLRCSWSLFINGSKSHTFLCPGPSPNPSTAEKNKSWCTACLCLSFNMDFFFIYNIYTLMLLVVVVLLRWFSPVCRRNHNQCLVSPRGVISLNTSVSYLIEPLPAAGDALPHAVYRAESLRLGGGSCAHHHGNAEHGAAPDDFIQGMTSSHRGRVSSDRMVARQHWLLSLCCCCFISTLWWCRLLFSTVFFLFFLGKKGPEQEYEVCRAASSGWQGWGEARSRLVLCWQNTGI